MPLNPYAVCRKPEPLPEKPLAVRVHVGEAGGWVAVMPSNYTYAKGRYMVICLSDDGYAETIMACVTLRKAYSILKAIPTDKP